MSETPPALKDIAESFRLALIAEVCEQAMVVRWADQVIASESSPPFAFFDISTSESHPRSATVGFLQDVPGRPTPDLPVYMLLGYCYAPVKSEVLSATKILVRLYKMSAVERFPERIYHALLTMEDELSLAHDRVYGTIEEVIAEFTDYLSQYVVYASQLPIETV